MMGIEVCMNGSCKGGFVREWKKGWPLRSGGFARLCDKCGSAYESLIFCEKFHLHQTGWRECFFCNKTIHCGCIVSSFMFKCLDFGGIGCTTCLRTSQLLLMRDTGNTNESVKSIENNVSDHCMEHIDNRLLVDGVGKRSHMQLSRINVEAGEPSRWPQDKRDSCIGPNMHQEDRRFSSVMKQSCSHSLAFTILDNNKPTLKTQTTMHKSSSLNMYSSALDTMEGRLEGKTSFCTLNQGQRPLSISKPLMNEIAMNIEASKGKISQERIARPPVDGKAKNVLLSRYWPRITDQELEKLSGDLKSIIMPLFEKILSASDVGRIGRLVLPKSCAEAYFPPISLSDGIPLQFKDVKGNDWTFQFRFWPNNNSRMYVLEGVTPCMQALHLNAGDIVTFSRIDPRGKFVMGFRRALDSLDTQDASTCAHSNDFSIREINYYEANVNLHSGNNYPDLLQTWRGNSLPFLNGCSEHSRFVSKKTIQNITPKSKRLLTHNEDTMELSVTWEAAQNLIGPPPNVNPSVVTIDNNEFEEFDQPPVFGNGTTINDHQFGSLRFASKEMNPKELENISKDSKRRRIVEKPKSNQDHESLGLDALATAILGYDHVDLADATTTKHPRHHSGCTCIVCIQPQSGKGTHMPSCTCFACTTMRRRFRTQMMLKQQCESEHEVDATQKDLIHNNDDQADNGGASSRDGACNLVKEGRSLNRMDELSEGKIDLNNHPNHEDMQVDI